MCKQEGDVGSGKGFRQVFDWSSKGGSIQTDSDAMMPETVDHGVSEGFSLEESVPIGVVEIGGDQSGFFLIAQLHESEEGVDLLGFEGEIAELVDQQDIVVG